MHEVPETTLDEIKLSPGKTFSAPVPSARVSNVAQCAEGDHLKQQYDSNSRRVEKHSQPQGRSFVEGEARAAFQLREEALAERNAAANRMYLHRASLRNLQAEALKRCSYTDRGAPKQGRIDALQSLSQVTVPRRVRQEFDDASELGPSVRSRGERMSYEREQLNQAFDRGRSRFVT